MASEPTSDLSLDGKARLLFLVGGLALLYGLYHRFQGGPAGSELAIHARESSDLGLFSGLLFILLGGTRALQRAGKSSLAVVLILAVIVLCWLVVSSANSLDVDVDAFISLSRMVCLRSTPSPSPL